MRQHLRSSSVFGKRILVLLVSIITSFIFTQNALAATNWVNGDPVKFVPQTSLYITSLSSGFNRANITYTGGAQWVDNLSCQVTSTSNPYTVSGIGIKAGQTTGSATVTYNNAGYTSDGKPIKVVLTNNITLHHASSQNCVVFKPQNANPYFSGDFGNTSAMSTYDYHNGSLQTVTVRIYEQDTNTEITDKTFACYFRDLDVPGFNWTSLSNDYNEAHSEGVELVSNCGSNIWVGDLCNPHYHSGGVQTNPVRLAVATKNGHTWVHATHDCLGGDGSINGTYNVPTMTDSAFAWIGTGPMTITWGGQGPGMGSSLGIQSIPLSYPDWTAPKKSPATQTKVEGEEVTFTVTQTFPYVVNSNKAKSITFTDTLDPALEPISIVASKGSWTYSTNNQTLKAVCSNTAHSNNGATSPEGDVTFTIKAKVRQGYTYPSSYRSGDVFRIPNEATTTIVPADGGSGGGTKTTNKVYVEVPAPKLSITKTVTPASVNVSDENTYTSVLTQTTANAIAHNVGFSDQLQDATAVSNGASYIEDSFTLKRENTTLTRGTNWNLQFNSARTQFTITTDQDLGGSESLTLTYKIKWGDKTSKNLLGNTYTNKITGNGTNATSASATAQSKVLKPELNVTKVADKTQINAGDTVNYTLTVKNTGEAGSIAWNLTFEDQFPSAMFTKGASVISDQVQVKRGSDVLPASSYTMTMNTSTGILAFSPTNIDLGANETITVTIPVKFGEKTSNQLSGATYENHFKAKADNANEKEATASVTVSDPQLSISKEASPTSVNTSDRISYIVTLKNTGPNYSNAYNVSITDALADDTASGGAYIDMSTLQLTYKDSNGQASDVPTSGVTPKNGTNGKTVGYEAKTSVTLAYNETLTATYTVVAGQTNSIALQDSSVKNTAFGESSNSTQKSNTVNRTVTVYTPELRIEKVTKMPIANVGDAVGYEVKVTQTVANAIAWNVTLDDVLPENLVNLGGTWDLNSLKTFHVNSTGVETEVSKQTLVTGNTLHIATEADLATNDQLKVTYNVKFGATTTRALQGQSYTNTITAYGDNTRRNVSDSATVHIPVPAAKMTKSVDKNVINVSEKVVCTLKVENIGEEGSCLRNVVITDAMPAALFENGATINIAELTHSIKKLDGTERALQLNGDITLDTTSAKLTINTTESLYKGEIITISIPIQFGERSSYKLCGAVYSDTATVSSDNADDASDSKEVSVLKPNITASKKASTEKVNVSDRIDYTIEVSNTAEGSLAFDPVIKDRLSEEAIAGDMRIDEATIKVATDKGTDLTALSQIQWIRNEKEQAIGYDLTVSPFDLNTSDKLIITYTVIAGNTTSVSLLTSGASNAISANVANDPDPRTDEVKITFYSPALTIEKAADKEVMNAGDSANYTLRVHQTEEGAIAWNVVVKDALSENAANAGAYIDKTSLKMLLDNKEQEYAKVTWTDDKASGFALETGVNLPKESEIIITYVVFAGTVSTETMNALDIDNIARATADNFPEGVDATEKIRIPDSSLIVEKNASPQIICTYDSVQYNVIIKVAEKDAVARNVSLEDVLPWVGDEGGVLPEKTVSTISAKLDGQDISTIKTSTERSFYMKAAEVAGYTGEFAESIPNDIANASGVGVQVLDIDFGCDLAYGETIEVSYEVFFGNEANRIPVPGQICRNVASAKATNNPNKFSAEASITIEDAILEIAKTAATPTSEKIPYSIAVRQVAPRAIAKYPVIEDKLAGTAISGGFSINKDITVKDADGADITSKCSIQYIDGANNKAVGYRLGLPDMKPGTQYTVNYTVDATGTTGDHHVENTAMAFADNAMQVNADAVARYSALVKAGDDFDPMALGLMVLVFSISSLSAVFIRRRNK